MRQKLAGGNGHVFGVAAAGQQSADFLPRCTSRDIVADRLDDTRDLHAEQFAGPRWRRIQPGGLQQVGPVDAGRADLDQHLSAARGDIRDLLPGELIGGSTTMAYMLATLLPAHLVCSNAAVSHRMT